MEAEIKHCLWCGGELTSQQKKYCSVRCSENYRYHNPPEETMRICKNCGKEFSSKTRLHCSDKCRNEYANNCKRQSPQPNGKPRAGYDRIGSIYFHSARSMWIAQLPRHMGQRKFYSKDKDKAIAKRNKYMRKHGAIELVKIMTEFCEAYGFTLKEFIELVTPKERKE